MPENNKMAERQYLKQFNKILTTVFNSQKAFAGAFAPIQILDGVQENATAFTVKTNNTPVVIGIYSTDANVAFGTGTGSTTRFGNRTEIKYANTDVPYDYTMTIHEGLDRFTVNNDLDAAVAERFEVQSQAQTRYMNAKNGTFLSTKAGNPVTITAIDEANIKAIFSAAAAYYKNAEVIAPVTAYVTPSVYDIMIESELITTAKNSSVNIDTNTLEMYKGFKIVSEPDQYFAGDDCIYFSPDAISIPFVGISTARTKESEDFDGVALQAAEKGGTYVSTDNATAITKVTVSA